MSYKYKINYIGYKGAYDWHYTNSLITFIRFKLTKKVIQVIITY